MRARRMGSGFRPRGLDDLGAARAGTAGAGSVEGGAVEGGAGQPSCAAHEKPGDGGGRRHDDLHAADGGSDLQLRRARLPGGRDAQVPGRLAPQERVHDSGRHCRDTDGVHGDVGKRQTGHRAGLGYRRDSSGLAETRRCLPFTAHRRGTGSRRGPQLGTGRQHHGRTRGQEADGAGKATWHDSHLAGNRGRVGRDEGVLRPRRILQRCRRRAVHARGQRSQRLMG